MAAPTKLNMDSDEAINRTIGISSPLPVHRFQLLLRQVHEAAAALGDHEVVTHLLTAAENAHRALDWPSDTQNYIARTAPSLTK